MSGVQKRLFIFAFISLLQVTLSLVKIEENKNDFGNEVKSKIESKTGHLDIKNTREKRNGKLEIINYGFEEENTEIESNDGIYPLKIAGYAVSLSAIAYCSDNVILSGNYSDNQLSSVPTIDVYPTDVEDFYPTNLIHDPELDVNGYMGYSLQQNLIFIVFRGSTSKENWKTDFDSVRTTYPMCPGYVQRCDVLVCIVSLFCTALWCYLTFCIVVYCCVTLSSAVLYYDVPFTVLYCIVSYCIVLYHIVLRRIVVYCIVLYCIVLCCIVYLCCTCIALCSTVCIHVT